MVSVTKELKTHIEWIATDLRQLEKLSTSGRSATAPACTPVHVKWPLDGDATVAEQGATRTYVVYVVSAIQQQWRFCTWVNTAVCSPGYVPRASSMYVITDQGIEAGALAKAQWNYCSHSQTQSSFQMQNEVLVLTTGPSGGTEANAAIRTGKERRAGRESWIKQHCVQWQV